MSSELDEIHRHTPEEEEEEEEEEGKGEGEERKRERERERERERKEASGECLRDSSWIFSFLTHSPDPSVRSVTAW